MTAEIISIGDELLIGQVINTNASWISEQFNNAGISISRITTIPDQKSQIISALKEASQRANIILITGGLGPTKDDITKDALCNYFNTKLIFSEDVLDNIKQLFYQRGFKVSELNRKQAEIPEKCTPVKNIHGTAPGLWFEQDGVIYVSMPGVPYEMKAIISDYVIPELLKRFNPPVILHKTVLTQGLPESGLAKKIESWEESLPSNIKLAYLPSPGMVRLRLSATGITQPQLETQINKEVDSLKKIIPQAIFGYDNDTLPEIIGRLLKDKNLSVSTAESCTGGYIAHLITSIAGSSEYFKGSVIAYSNEIKENLLGVSAQNLIDHGAVSEQVIKEMALGVKKKMGTDFSIATSGIAGPGGGTEEKPVGTTWIAVATPSKIITKHFMMGDHRERNIKKTAMTALNMLRLEILSED